MPPTPMPPLGAPSPMDGDALGEAISALCSSDDAVGLDALFISQQTIVAHGMPHGRHPIEAAYEADAVQCFQSIDALARAQGAKNGAIHQRLSGGQTPAMRCCFHPGPDGLGRGAPKCLAWILETEPLAGLASDGDRLTALDWAAMCPDPEPFKLLLSSMERALSQLVDKPDHIKQAVSKAAFLAVSHAGSAAICMEVLGSLSRVGVDWRALRSERLDWGKQTWTGDGQCLLGAAIDRCSSTPAGASIALALLEAGADPMSPFTTPHGAHGSGRPAPAVPLAQRLLDPVAAIILGLGRGSHDGLAKAVFAAVSDADLLAIGDATIAHYKSGSLADAIGAFRSGCGPDPILDVCARHASLREKLTLSAGPAPPLRGGIGKKPGI